MLTILHFFLPICCHKCTYMYTSMMIFLHSGCKPYIAFPPLKHEISMKYQHSRLEGSCIIYISDGQIQFINKFKFGQYLDILYLKYTFFHTYLNVLHQISDIFRPNFIKCYIMIAYNLKIFNWGDFLPFSCLKIY